MAASQEARRCLALLTPPFLGDGQLVPLLLWTVPHGQEQSWHRTRSGLQATAARTLTVTAGKGDVGTSPWALLEH